MQSSQQKVRKPLGVTASIRLAESQLKELVRERVEEETGLKVKSVEFQSTSSQLGGSIYYADVMTEPVGKGLQENSENPLQDS